MIFLEKKKPTNAAEKGMYIKVLWTIRKKPY